VEGNSSYYISFTRLEASGVLLRGGKPMRVKGVAWHDHEFMSTGLGERLKGWKWFSIMLDNDTELMLFHVLRKDGSVDPYSSGTIIFPDGRHEHIELGEFEVEDLGFWYSKKSDAKYPVAWRIRVPKYGLEIEVRAVKEDQELHFGGLGFRLAYWEGACDVSGTFDGKDIKGYAYVELVGYGKGKIKL